MDAFNFKTLGTKLSKHEANLVESYCKRKGITPSKFIHDILMREINITVPNNIAGKNILNYHRETDTFSWFVKLDNGETIEIIANMSPQYLEDINLIFSKVIEQRNSVIEKKSNDSIAIPSKLLGKKPFRGVKNA